MWKMKKCISVYLLTFWAFVLVVLTLNSATYQESVKLSSLRKVDHPTIMVEKVEESKEADYGLELRKDKLSKEKLLEKIEKENEEIVKHSDDNTLQKKKFSNKKKLLKKNPKENKSNSNEQKNEKDDDKRVILNAKEKYIKNKMGRGVQEQIRDHGQGVVEKIVSELKHERLKM